MTACAHRSCERIRNEGKLEPQKAQKAQETYVLLVPFVVLPLAFQFIHAFMERRYSYGRRRIFEALFFWYSWPLKKQRLPGRGYQNGFSKDGIHYIDWIDSADLHCLGPADPASGRQRVEERGKDRRRLAHLRPYSGRNTIQPA